MNLKKVENIEISRSYSRTIQLAQYEPMTQFSSYKAIMKPGSTDEEIKEVSEELYQRCEEEVDHIIESFKNPGKVMRRMTTRAMEKLIEVQGKKIEELEIKVNGVPF
jgi:uncharacterized protein YicC (UPF0701 family)